VTCRFAASTGGCTDRPVPAVLEELHAAHVMAVEVGTPPRHFDPWRHEEVMALGDSLKRLSIRPVAIHAPFGGLLDLTDPNPHHRHAAIGATLCAASAFASKYGGWSIAAGKFSAFCKGRLTAFTVCGVIHHSPRLTG